MATSIDSITPNLYNHNFMLDSKQKELAPTEAQPEIALDEDSDDTQSVIQGLQDASKPVTENIDNFARYLDSIATSEPQLLPPEIILANIMDYQERIIQYSNDLLTKVISSTNKLTVANNQELRSLTQQIYKAIQQQANINESLHHLLPETKIEINNDEILQRLWSGVIKNNAPSTNNVSTSQNPKPTSSSSTVGYPYHSGSGCDALLTCLILSISLLIMANSYEAAEVQADYADMYTDKMNLVVQLNQLLAPLDSYYKEAIVGYNNIKDDDKESDITTLNFDDEEIAEAANNSKSGFDEKVVRKDGKNIWYVSVDEIPEAARSYFVVVDGTAQVTSSGIQDFVKYVSDATASVIPGYGNETNIANIFTDSALESAQISSFETGLNNIISQLQSLISSAMSAASSYIDNADSIAKFCKDWLEKYEQLF